jgi:2-oxoglutarate dehydrogenase E1 component
MSIKAYQASSYLAGVNAAYLEELYEAYLADPSGVEPKWREYFSSIQVPGQAEVSHEVIRDAFKQRKSSHQANQMSGQVLDETGLLKQLAVDRLIEAYRRFGHLSAKIDPLGAPRPSDPRLDLAHYGLAQADMTSAFHTRGLLETTQAPLSIILETLKRVYCGTVGVEYSTIANEEERHWLRDYVEQRLPKRRMSSAVKISVLQQLIAAETLEKYLDVKYVGQKRFSIEGADSLIPILDELVKRACEKGMKEIVIGMAHRGRLNVLLNVMGHPPQELFLEFEGKKEYGMSSGDVKYHRGYSRDVLTEAGVIHLALAFNPSHLEFINPVIMGSVRARQDRQAGDQIERFKYAMPIQIHGDAAFAAQGVVMETLAMSQTRAHNVGGSLHIVINNQVGFTTSRPDDARSSVYCSDTAKMLDVPVFHVNGDDPEMAVLIAEMALDYRDRFHKDIVIDLVCYRRHGHQEVDEPTATQPMMYKIIREHATPRRIYSDKLVREGICTSDQVEAWVEAYRSKLDKGEDIVMTEQDGLTKRYAEQWSKYIGQVWTAPASTGLAKSQLMSLAQSLVNYPAEFELQRQVQAMMTGRKKMAAGEQDLDWGFAETLAYASLLSEGLPVRLVGEDCRRGTFYHRHTTLFDQKTGAEYMPLYEMPSRKARVQVYDSLLSEAGALGYEYGYSSSEPRGLTIWEAQFGDFANAAQVIVDQFISSAWQKWNRLAGVTLLLPHGYEGQGPEHSSARLERYLQLCAQFNMQVCVPSTPAQIFHLLRRQALRPYRVPLIVMSPKSFLRHKLAVSSLDDLAEKQFQLIIPEIDALQDDAVTRVILCSGKVYYDLLEARRAQALNHVAIIRIEQLYPFPREELAEQLRRYRQAQCVVWCQEEPKNQGAWFVGRHRLVESMRDDQHLFYAGREPSAAPAAGYPALHKKQQMALIEEALHKSYDEDLA